MYTALANGSGSLAPSLQFFLSKHYMNGSEVLLYTTPIDFVYTFKITVQVIELVCKHTIN